MLLACSKKQGDSERGAIGHGHGHGHGHSIFIILSALSGM
jgi:hypothetical protein